MLQGDCCIMKRVVALIWRVILLFLSMIVFLFSVGTVIPAFPVVGSVANIVTVGFLHLWLPLCIALVLLSLFPAVRRGGDHSVPERKRRCLKTAWGQAECVPVQRGRQLRHG